MVTLQDISLQLMKSAKDLADWSFPLSQVLEEYYALLEEPCAINFGEAALVLQNSANVYVRRVECLFDETSDLNQRLNTYETVEKAKSSKSERKGKNKVCIDLSDFKPLNLAESMGKNINITKRCNGQKTVKLISRRFTQLECNKAQLYDPIEIFDVHGEVIGKKYDFRCNQYLNTNGVLVDELTPDDFESASVVDIEKNLLLTCTETDLDRTRSSGYHSNTSFLEISSNCSETCVPAQDTNCNLSDVFSDTPTPSPEMGEGTFFDTVDQPVDASRDSCLDTTNTLTEDPSENFPSEILPDRGKDECESRESNSESTGSVTIGPNDKVDESTVDANANNIDTISKDATIDSGYLSGSPPDEPHVKKRRSQRMRNTLYDAPNLNDEAWKPIPFTHGTSKVKDERDFKLPCSVTFPKSRSEIRKRKAVPKVRKREPIMKFFLDESGLSYNDTAPYVPPKQAFAPLKKEEIAEFAKAFDDCLKNSGGLDDFHHAAVRNITMDFLNYAPCRAEQCPASDAFPRDDDDSDVDAVDAASVGLREYRTPSPIEASFARDAPTPKDARGSLPNYQRLIADKVKEVVQETDVRSELEQTVAKWHETLLPKLAEAERRPAFCMRDYASQVVRTLRTIDRPKVQFDAVVRGKPATEVARYFLATLQLANSYEVKLQNSENSDGIELVLLNAEGSFDN